MKHRSVWHAPLALLVSAALVSASPPAHAADGMTAEARARFDEGVKAYDRGDYEVARAKFLQAYALKKHPDVLLNLGWSHLRCGRRDEAAAAFEGYLADAESPSQEKRADAERGLAEARGARADVGTAETRSAELQGEADAGAAVPRDGRRGPRGRREGIEASALLGLSTDGLSAGLGARGGTAVADRIYVGGSIVYNVGQSASFPTAGGIASASSSVWIVGAEAGYDLQAGPLVVRPYAGLGVAILNSSVRGPGIDSSASRTEPVLWPGAMALYDLPNSRVTVGGDVHLLTVPGGPAMSFFAMGGTRF